MKLENFDEVSAAFDKAVKSCAYRCFDVAGATFSFSVPAGYTRAEFISAMFAREGTAPKKVMKDLVKYAKRMSMFFPEDSLAFCETLSFSSNPFALECFAIDDKGPCGLVSLTASFLPPDDEDEDLWAHIDLGSVYVAKDCRGKGIMPALVEMVGAALGLGFEAALKLLPESLPLEVVAYGEVHSISGYKYAESFMAELGIQLGFQEQAPDVDVNTWKWVSADIDGRKISISPDIGD